MTGVLYVIQNKHYPNYVKVGRARDFYRRMASYNSSAPEPMFVEEYVSEVFSKVDIAEKMLLTMLGGRLGGREWFKISKDKAIDAIISLEALEEEELIG